MDKWTVSGILGRLRCMKQLFKAELSPLVSNHRPVGWEMPAEAIQLCLTLNSTPVFKSTASPGNEMAPGGSDVGGKNNVGLPVFIFIFFCSDLSLAKSCLTMFLKHILETVKSKYSRILLELICVRSNTQRKRLISIRTNNLSSFLKRDICEQTAAPFCEQFANTRKQMGAQVNTV